MLTALVTGATEGIGHQSALALAKRGYRVLVHGRTEAKAQQAAQAVGPQSVPVWGDFSLFDQVRALAGQVAAATPVLDVLLNNAGVFQTRRAETPDGHEVTFQVNHLSPFLLTRLLLTQVQAAAQGRVVNVSSGMHSSGRLALKDLDLKRHFDGSAAYSNSKLANVLFTHQLARVLTGAATTCALHPGVISTRLLREGWGGGGSKVETGARTTVFCCTAPELAKVTGRYYSDAREVPCARHANDPQLEQALWEVSSTLTGLG